MTLEEQLAITISNKERCWRMVLHEQYSGSRKKINAELDMVGLADWTVEEEILRDKLERRANESAKHDRCDAVREVLRRSL